MSLPRNTVQMIDDLVNHWQMPPEILVVDDDEFVCDILAKALTSLGLEVKIARDGRQAVDVYRHAYNRRFQDVGATSHPFDLIFLDVRLPGGIEGMEVLGEMRTLWPMQPVVMISGVMENVTGFTKHGPVCIDEKPITIDNVRLALAMHNIRMPLHRR